MNDMIRYSWILGLMVIAALGWAVFEYVQFRGRLLKSKELIEEATPFSFEPAGTPPSRILVAGDSTAVGVGSAGRDSIAGRVHGLYPEASLRNIGVSGMRTAGLEDALRGVQGDKFDVVILQIGGNDIVQRTSLDDLKRSIGEALDIAHGLGRQVVLLTSGDVGSALILPRITASFFTKRTLLVRDIFRKAATTRGTAYVDLFQEKSVDPFAIDPDRYYAADYFHPSAEGYGVWFERVGPVVQQAIENGRQD